MNTVDLIEIQKPNQSLTSVGVSYGELIFTIFAIVCIIFIVGALIIQFNTGLGYNYLIQIGLFLALVGGLGYLMADKTHVEPYSKAQKNIEVVLKSHNTNLKNSTLYASKNPEDFIKLGDKKVSHIKTENGLFKISGDKPLKDSEFKIANKQKAINDTHRTFFEKTTALYLAILGMFFAGVGFVFRVFR